MKMIHPTQCLAIFCALLTTFATAAADLTGPHTIAWTKAYNNSRTSQSVDLAKAVAVDSRGNVIVTGESDGSYLTTKYAAGTGARIWKKRYINPDNYNISEGNKPYYKDSPTAIVVDGSDNVIVTGSSRALRVFRVVSVALGYRFDDIWDFYTAKYAADTGALLWERRYNGPRNGRDIPTAIAVDASGNVFVTGISGNADHTNEENYTAKYAAGTGALLWEGRYGGTSKGEDIAKAIAVDASGDVVITGKSDNDDSSYNPDFYTAKYAGATGALLWEKRFNGPADSHDHASAVAIDGSGNVIVTGSSVTDYPEKNSTSNFYTAKYAGGTGTLLWEKRFDRSTYDTPTAIALDASGNVFVTGTAVDRDAFVGDQGSVVDFYTVKYAGGTGTLLWEKLYNNPLKRDGFVADIAVDNSGNAVITGYLGGYYNDDYYTAKYSGVTGALFWEKHYNGPSAEEDRAVAIAVDGSGNVIVTGSSEGRNVSFPTLQDYYTAKYASGTGALLWEKRFDAMDDSDDKAAAIAVDRNGDVSVLGKSSAGNIFHDYTAKYAGGNGAQLWERPYNGLYDRGASRGLPTAIAMDGSGNVIVTGSAERYFVTTENLGIYTAKYAAGTGVLLWEMRYRGYYGNHSATAIVVDGRGDVIVTGRITASNHFYNYYTAKYAGGTGALLWERHYNGPGDKNDSATAIAVDAGGNVVVTGSSVGIGGNADIYTAKYAAQTGVRLWEKRYNGTGNSDDKATAIAVDGSGNVIVTGSSIGTGGNTDYYTAKYAAGTGARLWEKRYNGTGNSNDAPSALAVDGSGNVIVTGASIGFGSKADFYTAKYAAQTGARLWESRYNGTGNASDTAAAIACDGSGNVVVTGSSGGVGGNSDIYTAAYAAANGAVLWVSRLNGSGNGDDFGTSLKLDASANVFVAGEVFNSNVNTSCFTMKIVPSVRTIGLSGNLAFGSVPVGSTKASVLTVTNTGNSPLSVSSITYPNGYSGAYTGSIPAGGSKSVNVTFRPTAVQSYPGTVTVNSNKTSGTNTKAVSGNGS